MPAISEDLEKVADLAEMYGACLAETPVCEGHCVPLNYLSDWVLDRPALSLVHGPRGGGKSHMSALATHLDSLQYPGHGTTVLGGSFAQSKQIQIALRTFWRLDRGRFRAFAKTHAEYTNESEVTILAASQHQVRGPHVPTIRLDEVDEIEKDIREAAMGMAMARNGVPASVSMTSTWHKNGGPMTELMEAALEGKFPLYRFCSFDILEYCPDERSGPDLENCPACPLERWCHSDRDRHPSGLPKAKRAGGHYAIDSLIQKANVLSARTFESDYLCLGPRAEGLWFKEFSQGRNVGFDAEFDPALQVQLSIDSGVFTGAVFFQVAGDSVRVFAEYLAEGVGAYDAAKAIQAIAAERCQSHWHVASTDPSGGARNPVGPTVIAEYERAGLRNLRRWPIGPVADGLALLEGLICAADQSVSLRIHPRCVKLIQALENYRRAKRGGQWQDYPEDPQHPSEEMVDALRGGCRIVWPSGRKPPSTLRRVPAGKVF